jgi:hypothetical protein
VSQAVSESPRPYSPPYPSLVALVLCSVWIAILSIPMWSGRFLASGVSDQLGTGYAWRLWQAEQWKALGHMPLWNPDIFGGLPYVAAMHGDVFYPTAWLRLFLPTAFAMDLGFVIHYVLAGFFAYLFLRRINVSWLGAVVGGLSYQLSGVVASYVHPGHDGKLFVTALLPLALMALWMAIRERRLEGYGILALTVGLAILSPHPQMAQYMLIAAGIFTLYLVFGEPTDRPMSGRVTELMLAFAAVVLGFLISAIQMFPFWEYIPFSPRAETYRGFEEATSYAIPWVHVPEFFLSSFVGQSAAGTYWGANPIKLHSEYLGLPVLALAAIGVAGKRRRLTLWLAGIAALFLLVALGRSTPFYRLWYEVVPFVKQTRAPGMALYIVAFVVSVYAAFGVEKLDAEKIKRVAVAWLAVGAGVALFAAVGAFGGMAVYLAQGIEQSLGVPAARTAAQAGSSIMWGALWSGLALAAIGGLAYAAQRGSIKPAVLCLGIVFIVSADLWRNAREFWVFTDARAVHAQDRLTEVLTEAPKPYRVYNAGDYVYQGSSLMTHDIPQLLGHHGNELHRFDELLGEKNIWRNQTHGVIWDLFAVNYVIVPTGMAGSDSIPGFELVLENQMTWNGLPANLHRREQPVPYGRLVPGGLKVAAERIVPTIINPRFPADRVVLFDLDSPVTPLEYTEIPEPLPNEVTFPAWEPGSMTIRIEPPPVEDAYLLVSENWYPDWNAKADGEPVPVFRGDQTLITVPVAAGVSEVELRFDSKPYRIGKAVTMIAVLIALAAIVTPVVLRKKASD